MRVVIQRVNHALVEIEGSSFSQIEKGLCIFLGIVQNEDENEIPWLIKKITHLRIFNDEQDKMNLSVQDIDGDIMLVSQFTLHASTKKGNRPSFTEAEKPERAEIIYKECIAQLEVEMGHPIQTGQFGGDMKVKLENDGPVTIIIDTQLKW